MTKAHRLSLEDRVEELCRDTGGQVDVIDIAGIVTSVMQTMRGTVTVWDLQVGEEISALLAEVGSARAELSALNPRTLSARDIPEASEELAEVINATEDAAGRMMDAAEELEALTGEIDAEIVDRLSGIATRIYEASTFQDITGQRIAKVAATLQHLEEKLGTLAEKIGDHSVENRSGPDYDESGNLVSDRAILHGPQLSADANSQDDIDALLASFD